MDEAIKEGYKGLKNKDGGPFGAVIVCKGKIISRGHSRVLKTHDPTAHAEIVAIREASKKLKRFNLSDCEIYSSSEPCPMCLGAIKWARIKNVYYSTTKNDIAKIGFDDKKFYEEMKTNSGTKKIKINNKSAKELLDSWKKFKGRLY